MRRRRAVVFAVGAVAVMGAGPLAVPGAAGAQVVAAAGAAAGGAVTAGGAAAGTWGQAMGVPGLAALNRGGNAEVAEVSCASAGNCTAGGGYLDRHDGGQGFVVGERHGRWGTAIEVPGLAALNVGGITGVGPVACGSAGNCVAGGSYAYDQTGFRFSPFIATESGGRWGKAVSLQRDGDVNSISCASAGNCVVAGGATGAIGEYYLVGDAYVLQQQAGHWGSVSFVPGLRKLENFGDPQIAGSWINSVTCPSAGNCAAGGGYTSTGSNYHGFVAVEQNGKWGKAIEVPGLAALNTGGSAEVNSVSCGSAGSCVAGGYYTTSGSRAFVAVEQNGTWGTAIPVPGLAALNTGGNAVVTSVSCGSAGSCVVGGSYRDGRRHMQVFVASERKGVWDTAIYVPGLPALNAGGNAAVGQVSCNSAGNCAAGGTYTDRSGHSQGFVVVERNGAWGRAIPVPGLGALNKGGSGGVLSVSCPSPGSCAADGFYTDRSGHHQGFVVTQAG